MGLAASFAGSCAVSCQAIQPHTVLDVLVDDEIQFLVREAVVLC